MKNINYYLENKEYILKRIKKYSQKYPWKILFNNIYNRCKNPIGNNACYKNIQCLITEDELKELWDRDNASEMKKPSIDRIDKYKNYEFSNCQFIELSLNSGKDKLKPVLQFDKQGNFIREWSSQMEASKKLKISNSLIAMCCRKERFSGGGFKWNFKEINKEN